jgi:predicted lipoprotein
VNAAGSASGPTPDRSGEVAWTFDIPEKPFSKPNLLEAVGHCALASYAEFEGHAANLAAATAALAQTSDEAAALSARAAWRTSMASWQRAEPFGFGPAARAGAPGGQDLRDGIYVFPLANYCQVDQQIVNQTYASADFATSLASARGLSALEYLLFNASAGNACLAALSINSSGAWAALGEQIWQRRANYAERAAQAVLERAQLLVNAWHPERGNFLAQLTAASQGSATFSNAQQAFNAISDGLFYIEKEVKDWKLGWPLGLVPDCVNAPAACPTEVESRYAVASTDHLRQNLVGFRRVFQGCGPDYTGLGFDDWLVEVGAADLALAMVQATEAAQAAVEALDPPLEQAMFVDPSRVRAVHTAIKAITDPLKTELVTVLNLDLPKASEGDND